MKTQIRTLGGILLYALLFVSAKAQVADADGNTYKTMKIGGKEWMMEDLKTSRFQNGEAIPLAQSDSEWDDAGEVPIYCKIETASGSAVLYSGFVMSDSRGVLPSGWRAPNSDDIDALIAACVSSDGQLNDNGKQFVGASAPSFFRQNNGAIKKDDMEYSWWIDIGGMSFMPAHTMQWSISKGEYETMIISARDEGHSLRMVKD